MFINKMGNTLEKFVNCPNLNIDSMNTLDDISRCVLQNLVGIKSETVSMSEQYILSFTENSFYNGIKLNKGFMKLFISSKNGEMNNAKEKGVIYEYFVYKYIILPLVRNNICVNFIKVYGGGLDISGGEVVAFLQNHLQTSEEETSKRFLRSICYMDNFIANKPSINTPSEQTHPDIIKKITDEGIKIDDYKFGYIINEGLDVTPEGVKRGLGVASKLEDVIFYEKIDVLEFIKIFYQITAGCYTMFIAGLNHNDLHNGNVYVKKIEPQTFSYYVSSKVGFLSHHINTSNLAMIYDFDQSYVEGFKGPHPREETLEHYDFIKIIQTFLDTWKQRMNTFKDNGYFEMFKFINSIIYREDAEMPLKMNLNKILGDSNYNLAKYYSPQYEKILRPLPLIMNLIYNSIPKMNLEPGYPNFISPEIFVKSPEGIKYVDNRRLQGYISFVIKQTSSDICKKKLEELENENQKLKEQITIDNASIENYKKGMEVMMSQLKI